MKVCVVGLWHLGTVTAACLASGGHEVVGLDFEPGAAERLQEGHPPLFEPGLEEAVREGLAEGRLRFTADAAEACRGAEVVWVAYDTPVDDEDRADVEHVVERARRLFPHLGDGALVLVSSQVPVGTTRRLEEGFAACGGGRRVTFGYSPENLRLGKALAAFTKPDRVVVGLREPGERPKVSRLLAPFTDRLEWMSVESAEMTKHALNAFLAVSVTYINEVASLCEQVGVDAKEVERGLKSEPRIGPRAYLSPGAAFAGGTLARDVAFLTGLGAAHGLPTPLIAGVRGSNEFHKGWPRRQLQSLVGSLRGARVAVWGLAYKPGTDTLRRSSSVELCRWLVEQGAAVRAHDPAVKQLPPDLGSALELSATAAGAVVDADALVVATEWPEYQSTTADLLADAMRHAVVVDANRFLAKALGNSPRIRYVAVGVPGGGRAEGRGAP